MCDWIDNAIAVQMSRAAGHIYGFLHLPCRVEVNARLAQPPNWRTSLSEFTGERVIPGQVDVDLLNEHVARYTFAARLARGKRVLDAGCGAGYGSAELAHEAERVTGIDRDPGALEFARANYSFSNLTFEHGDCEALAYDAGAFDLVVAFEVIEHLADWRGFLAEVRRVLSPGGQFVVSTPNKDYYTESRGSEGANPFHVHEFGFEEFRSELQAVFPHVSLFLENHVEGVTFQPFEPGNTTDVRVDAATPILRARTSLSRSAHIARRSAIRPSSTSRAPPMCCASASAISPCSIASSPPRITGSNARSASTNL